MQSIIAPVHDIKFDIEAALEIQLGSQPLPFPGMDKSGAAICRYFRLASCSKGVLCPFRHLRGEQQVVCKHWLRGLCKKGDLCEFLHEYDLTKMPECYFFAKFGQCSNTECQFLHIDPESKVKDCPWYDRGFCKHGPTCRNRHRRRVMCPNYLCGLCLDGKDCKFTHPRFDLPTVNPTMEAPQFKKIICHSCGEPGHKSYQCLKSIGRMGDCVVGSAITTTVPDVPSADNGSTDPINSAIGPASGAAGIPSSGPGTHSRHPYHPFNRGSHHPRPHRGHYHGSGNSFQGSTRSLDQIICYKCGEKGHYANRCPKGHLAFISAAVNKQIPIPES